MKNFYFTFGQIHTHSYNGKTLDKNTVILIKADSKDLAIARMEELFGSKWSMQYTKKPCAIYYPNGVIEV